MGRKHRITQEPTNEERVELINAVFDDFEPGHRIDPDSAVIDLLTDLQHWCHARNINFHEKVRIAAGNYFIECNAPDHVKP